MESRLYTQYKEKVVLELKTEFGYVNLMQVPKITHVVLNVGYGRHVKDKVFIDNVEKTLAQVSGQRPVHNKAKKSISNFKIREGLAIGASVTLRGTYMYSFLYRLVNIVLPRVRDFRGLNPKSFDARGNYTLGLKENIAFPEIQVDSNDRIHGLEITIVTSAKTSIEAKSLLIKLGFPFRDK